MTASEPATVAAKWGRGRPRWRWIFGLLGLAVAGALLGFWPARRNYYGKRDRVEQRLDLPYVAGSTDRKQQLDLYWPRTDAKPPSDAKPVPIVVFVHGGYWSALDRRWMQPLLGAHGNVGVALAMHGIAAAIVGYRQYPSIQRGDDSLDDIARAVGFVRASCPTWGCGPIYVVGHSAGGHLASLIALNPEILRRNGVDPAAVAGYVSIDGIFDLNASLTAFEPDQVAVLRQLFGPDASALSAHSSSAYARAQHPRLLFLDSTGDAQVCRDAFHRMKARMAAAGSPAEFVELAGLGHNEIIIRMGMDDDPLLPSLLIFIR